MKITEVVSTSKLVTVNKSLNPVMWHDGELDSKVQEALLKIAEKFEEFIGIDLPVKDITITGSNANYTWTKHSDLDLHLIVPGTPTEAERELYSAKKALWSEQHDIMVRGLEVECYVQGEDEPHHSTGVYSIKNNKWIVEPKKVKPDIDDAAVTAKTRDLVELVKAAWSTGDLERLRAAKDKITKMRKSGLERAGEWSTENLAFKQLRNLGIIDRVTDRIRDLEDQELSLENSQLS